MAIELRDYDPIWSEIYKKEAFLIKKALKDSLIEIHHFGSTSIPNLKAKPKIDILVVVKSFDLVDSKALEELGYEIRGEIIPTGRYFSKRKPIKINLHLFEQNNPTIEKDLLFRDWLKEHPEDRKAYEKLKIELAEKHINGMKYCKDKTDFINKIVEKASKAKNKP